MEAGHTRNRSESEVVVASPANREDAARAAMTAETVMDCYTIAQVVQLDNEEVSVDNSSDGGRTQRQWMGWVQGFNLQPDLKLVLFNRHLVLCHTNHNK